MLPLALVSHRFHDIILRLLHRRLLSAARLQDRKLILECFHPSAKLTTPGLLCDYVGTDGSDIDEATLYSSYERIGQLGKLVGLYSRFKPVGAEQNRRPRRRNPMFPVASTIGGPEIPSQVISLESHELFSQLCTIANLVKTIPNSDFILSCVTIGEGVIRVWRDWLAERAIWPERRNIRLTDIDEASTELENVGAAEEKSRILWLDNANNVGIRVRVIEREDLSAPVLLGVGEDAYVSYNIEYEGEFRGGSKPSQASLEAKSYIELFIRTTQLLLKVEESIQQEAGQSGKAIVIGTFAM